MANKTPKPRTNWTAKQRRITGVITFAVIVLVVFLCCKGFGSKSNTSVAVAETPAPAVAAAPAATKATTAATTAPVAEPVKAAEPVVEVKEAVVEEAPVAEAAPEKEVNPAIDAVAKAFADAISTAINRPATTPEEAAPVEAPVEEPAPVVEEVKAPVVEEAPVAEPVVEEAPVVGGTYAFDVYGYGVSGSYAPEYFDSYADQKGVVKASDIMGFAGYENGKYGTILNDVIIDAQDDGFVLSYPAGIDASQYIDAYQADIYEYVNQLLAPVVSVEEVVEEPVKEAPVAEVPAASTYAFDVYGYTVSGTYSDGYFDSFSATKGILTAEDIMGFVAYENGKYGTFLTDNVTIDVVADGFVLAIPAGIDATPYIDQYQADIIEYVNALLASVQEAAPAVAEEALPADEVEVQGGYMFDVFGYMVSGSYSDGYFDSYSVAEGILTAEDIMGFVAYENGKYGTFLTDNVTIDVVADGFVLTIPAGIDATPYIDQYQKDIVEYIGTLFATAPVEAPVAEVPVEEPETKAAYAFDVFGYEVTGTYSDGYFDSFSATKGILTAEDIMGFVAYENGKYGTFLTDNVTIDVVADGFVLAIPAGIDAAPYIDQYQADIIEYVNTLFAAAPVEAPVVETPVAEPVVEPVAAPVVEPAPVPETPAVETPAEPAPVPEKIDSVEVVVLTDGAEKPAATDAPAAEKIKYNNFKVKTSIMGGFSSDVENSSLGTKRLQGTLSVETQNIIQIGTRVGIGARFDGSLAFRPSNSGWGTVVKNPASVASLDKWSSAVSASAKLMFYGNFNKATMYAGAGFGYSVATEANRTHTTAFNQLGFKASGVFVDAAVGMSVDLSKHFGVGIDLDYKHFLSAPAQDVKLSVAFSYTF